MTWLGSYQDQVEEEATAAGVFARQASNQYVGNSL